MTPAVSGALALGRLFGLPLTEVVRWSVIAVLAVLAVPATRRAGLTGRVLAARVARCSVGLTCFGSGIALIFGARLGLGPWDVLHEGIAELADLPVGLVINLVGIVLLLLWILLKEPLGLGTVLNALVIGIVLDLVRPLLGDPSQMAVRVGYLVGGMAAIAVGSALYLGAQLGAGPRDGLMMSLNRFGLSIQMARAVIEFTTLALGWLLGGTVGLGTVLFAVGIGPLVQLAMRLIPPVSGTPEVQPSDRISGRAALPRSLRSERH